MKSGSKSVFFLQVVFAMYCGYSNAKVSCKRLIRKGAVVATKSNYVLFRILEMISMKDGKMFGVTGQRIPKMT